MLEMVFGEATLARVVGEELEPTEAQDSLDSLAYWKDPNQSDPRPRHFFCHLGPPYGNDALAVRKGSRKMIVRGGLARPWASPGERGGAIIASFHDLRENLQEEGDFSEGEADEEAKQMLEDLLRIHNQGHSRPLGLPDGDQLILEDGWHNLRNDLTGVIGYSFELSEDRTVSHLGMWDDHDRESPLRPARGIPSEKERDQPSREGKKPRTLKSPHLIALWKRNGKSLKRITGVELQDGNPGELVAGGIADAVARGLDRMHLDACEIPQDRRNIGKLRPVELDVLARGEVTVSSIIGSCNVGKFAQLR